jgi:hypothetical protein
MHGKSPGRQKCGLTADITLEHLAELIDTNRLQVRVVDGWVEREKMVV